MSSFVFVQPHLRFGGAERQTVSVANALVGRGHRVSVILHSADGGLVSTLRPEVDLHVLDLESHIATVEVARRLAAVLRRQPPSLVVVKLWSSILAVAMVDRSPALRHHTYNYCEDLDPTDHASYIRLGALKQRLIGRVFRSRAHLTANTETVASSMVEVYRLRHRPTVIPSTVEPSELRRLAAAAPSPLDVRTNSEDRFTVVSVGSLIPRKGLDVTKDALENLGCPVHWRIVGEGPLASRLTVLTNRQGPLSVTVERGTANPYGFMAAADLLVHSARSEAWGIVLLEAMSVGTPVVAAGAIGPTEMQRSLGIRTDLLRTVPVGDVSALRSAVRTARETPRAPLADFDAYVAPFNVQRAAAMWEARAAALAGAGR